MHYKHIIYISINKHVLDSIAVLQRDVLTCAVLCTHTARALHTCMLARIPTCVKTCSALKSPHVHFQTFKLVQRLVGMATSKHRHLQDSHSTRYRNLYTLEQ